MNATLRSRSFVRAIPLLFAALATIGVAAAADKKPGHVVAAAAPDATAAKPATNSRVLSVTSDPDSAVIRDLLAGRDARASVAEELAHPEMLKAKAAAAASLRSSAFAAYSEGVRHLQHTLGTSRNAFSKSERKAVRTQLGDALTTLRASKLLVDARIEQIDRLVAARTMPAVARQRWAAHRAALVASVSQLDDAALRATNGLAGTAPDFLPTLGELEQLVAAETRVSALPTYAAATLPVFRPRLAGRDPVTSPVLTPTYADAANDNVPVAADYATSVDAPLSPAILSEAQSLGNDYTRILDFVRSQVRTQWYAGSQKGAEGTLRTLAGNDVDQASLLIALLRASSAAARYVRGVVDVPVDDLAVTLGVRADEVGLALGAAGVANRPVVVAGRISAFAIEQVYVSAYLPFSNYRGTTADLEGRTWIPMAPAIKPHAFVAAAGALAKTSIAADTFVQQYLSTTQARSPLDLLRQQVSDRLSNLSPPVAYNSQLAQLSVSASPLELLPASLPVPVEAVTGEFAVLPDNLLQHARIVVRAGPDNNDAIVFDQTVALTQLLDHRVTLSYAPASIDDGRIADQHGGLGTTPPYLIHVRPVLNVSGLPAAAGTGEIENGASHRLEITLDGPGGMATLAQVVTAGGIAALVFDAQGDSSLQQADDVALPGDSETKAAKILANFGARYLSTWDQADDELARLVGVGVVRPFPSVALVINQYVVNRVGGLADGLVWRGVGLDAALRPVEPFAQTANMSAAADWLELASLEGSVLEHQLFEQQWSVDSISADKGLALARANGQPVLTLTQNTGTAGVNQLQSVLDDISQWLSLGYVVDVPRDPITYINWTGAVWRVHSLSTGESGYFISGALAGGSTAMPPSLWYFQDLVALLGNPYGQDPDTDPFSGVALTLDADSQYQDGVVGTELAKALRATVIDSAGRPVQGAHVTFSVTQGLAKFMASGGAFAQIVSATDRNGVASVRVRLDQKLGNLGVYRSIPGKQYPQFVGYNGIEVSAAAKVGTLYSGQPYVEYSVPDAPSKLKLAGDANLPLIPGMSYNSFAAKVTDQYENDISNIAIGLNAATLYKPLSCGSTWKDPIDATLFEPGQCPDGIARLTGETCAKPSIALTSRYGGAPFFVVPPNSGVADVTVAGNAVGGTDTLHLQTDPIYDPCPLGFASYAVNLWVHTPVYGFVPQNGEVLNILDAAAPGQVMAAPQQIDAFQGIVLAGPPASITWTGIDNATFDSRQLQNGSVENVRNVGNGTYLQDLRAGPEPGPVHGQIFIDYDNQQLSVRGGARNSQGSSSANPDDFTFAWSVGMRAPGVTPALIPLTPFAVTDSPIKIQNKSLPADYIASPVQLEILQGEEVIATSSEPSIRIGDFFATIDRGLVIDKTKHYSVRTVLNDGTPFRFESPEAQLSFGQGIVGGYGILPHAVSNPPDAPSQSQASDATNSTVLDEVGLVQGRYPKAISIQDSVDVPSGYACAVSKRFAFVLEQDATVSLVFHDLDAQGNVSPITAFTALDSVAKSKGLQDVAISSADLPIGDYQYELKATASDGTVENYVGVAAHHTQRRDSLPLAHPFVKGVDLYSGGAVLSEEDVAVGGRGPGMKLTRTYASHQGDERTWFGRGWSSDLDMQVRTDDCNTRIVDGSAGRSQRYAPTATDADGTVHFSAILHTGYHGTLLQKGAEYDFYAKDGTRYHFGQVDTNGPRISYIEDTNSNRVSYTYEINQGAPRISRVEDGAKRHIDLHYLVKKVTTNQSGIAIEDSFTVVDQARGPGGLVVDYGYDAAGNLIDIKRSDGTSGGREQGYGYQDLGGQFFTQADGAIKYYRFGWRLMNATNALDRGKRDYGYEVGYSAYFTGDQTIYEPQKRANSVKEPDNGETVFDYGTVPLARGLTAATTTVTDANGHDTSYLMNRYGAAETVTDPVGTAATVWDLTHLEPLSVEDAEHTTTVYTYDDAGNKTSERIQGGNLTIARSWTYKPQEQFPSLFIRDRVDTATDEHHNATQFDYDLLGNRKVTTRGGIPEYDDYDPNGDHSSHTDGLHHFWSWHHDSYGYPREIVDPLKHPTAMTYDIRGRELDETDANGHKTSYTYDARDRLLSTTYPETEAGVATATSEYDDSADTRVDTDPRQKKTTSSFDKMGRLVGVLHADGLSRALLYDKNGSLTDEDDFSGNHTTYVYDAANRRTETHAPENRITITDYDRLGHVTRETFSGPASETRITDYEYKHPLYKRTLVRRHLGETINADEKTEYDDNANTVKVTDPVGRTTKRSYDARDRMYKEEYQPYNRTTTFNFFGDDRTQSQTIKNPGYADQVTTYEYDDAGRLTATVDPVNDRRTIGYDNTSNVTSRSDARGNPTKYEYNARDELITETGPETGQSTTYTNDLAGNRETEHWPNGNVRRSTYDDRERRKDTHDNVGLVESFEYTPDDQVRTRTDANVHVTENHYDGLHRVTTQDLPTVAAGERHTIRTYDVHGGVLTEKDPGGHTTTYSYDSLGRRTSMALPKVDDKPGTITYDYDLVDRLTLQKDARGFETHIVFDDQAHTKIQTDPPTPPEGSFSQVWSYDAVGNEISHTDRRGIATIMRYDAANRIAKVTRGNITTSTRTHEDGRLKTDEDANHHITTNVYDKAGRRVEEDRPGATRNWTYTPMGDVETATDVDNHVTTNTYTPRRYLESEKNNFGETTTYGYDGEGHRSSMQRPMGEAWTWTYRYDAGDRLDKVTDPNAKATAYYYDLDGNRTSQTDTNQYETTYGYDERHRRTRLTYPPVTQGAPSAASAGWKYDDDGNVTEIDTPNGRTRILDVNALNHVTHESIDNAAAGEISDVAYTHDGNGNILTVAETIGSVTRTATRTYDVLDRLSTDVDVHHKSLLYGYDDVGNPLSVTDNTDPNHQADITVWTYNALNQNISVTVPGRGTTLIANYPSGLVHVVTRPGSITTTTQYNGAGRIATITHANAGGEIAHDAYDYDLNGNRTYQRERNGDLTQNAEQTTAYTYDKNDWLTDITVGYGAVPERTTHYVLDDVGNRTTEQIRNAQGALISNSTLAYNEREQLTSRDDSVSHLHVDLSYDADGNTATETDSTGTLHFGWDGHDRLLALGQNLQSPKLIFDYQSDGLRIAKIGSGFETDYHYDGQSLLSETNNQGNLLVRYHYSATELLSRTESSGASTERQYLNDALSTPIATMNQGAVDSRTKYDAWGEITSQQGLGGAITNPSTDGTFAELPSADNQDIGFTGYVKDSETGFYYAKARYHDPRIARFASGDPEEGKAMEPPSLNRYLYAYANPTVYTDPTGREQVPQEIRLLQQASWTKDPEQRAQLIAQSRVLDTEKSLALAHEMGYALAGYDLAKSITTGLALLAYEGSAIQLENATAGAIDLGGHRLAQVQAQRAKEFLSNHPIEKIRLGITDTLSDAHDLDTVDPIGAARARGGLVLQGATYATGAYGVLRGATTGLGNLASKFGAFDSAALTTVDVPVAAQLTANATQASKLTPSQLHSEPGTLGSPVGASDAVRPIERKPNTISARPVAPSIKGANGEVAAETARGAPSTLHLQRQLAKLTAAQRDVLVNDPQMLARYLRSGEIDAIVDAPWTMRLFFGTALQRRVTELASTDSSLGVLRPTSGNAPQDFVGPGNLGYDITGSSPVSILNHAKRLGIDAVVTYDSIPSNFGFQWVKDYQGE